jgi:hypothetical protein
VQTDRRRWYDYQMQLGSIEARHVGSIVAKKVATGSIDFCPVVSVLWFDYARPAPV